MDKILVTMRDIQKYKVLTEVLDKKLTARIASELLDLSYRHALRLKDQEDIEIQRALEELGITLIPANSPRAKGHIEVTFRLF